MGPELTGVLIGGCLALAGNLLTQIVSLTQQNRTLEHERQKDLMLKRLVAIQNCVKMIDFLVAAKNATLGPKGHTEWIDMRMENNANGAFFPLALSGEFKDMIRRCLFHDSLADSEKWLDFERLEKLRENCIRYIEKNFK